MVWGFTGLIFNHANAPTRKARIAKGHNEGSLSGSNGHLMKPHEYIEGPEAHKNFERGMIALFKVPKSAVLKAKKQPKKAAISRKSKKADKD